MLLVTIQLRWFGVRFNLCNIVLPLLVFQMRVLMNRIFLQLKQRVTSVFFLLFFNFRGLKAQHRIDTVAE